MLDFRFVEKMELLQLARSGDEEARLKFIRQYFYLTIIYKEELITYLEELSENGNIEAQSNLGEYKTNLNPDDIELLVKSSKQGYFWSDLLLFNYLSNRAKGDEKLTTIFKQISINNEIYQMHIGKIYSSGLEDEIDYIKAYNHLQKAVVINQSINNEDRKNLFELVSAGEYF